MTQDITFSSYVDVADSITTVEQRHLYVKDYLLNVFFDNLETFSFEKNQNKIFNITNPTDG